MAIASLIQGLATEVAYWLEPLYLWCRQYCCLEEIEVARIDVSVASVVVNQEVFFTLSFLCAIVISATIVWLVDSMWVRMVNHIIRQKLILQWVFMRPECHCVKAIASSKLRQLFYVHTLLHDFFIRTVKHLLRIPPPDSFPCFVWIYFQWIQHHNQTCWSTVRGLLLCRELLCKLEVVLHTTLHECRLE